MFTLGAYLHQIDPYMIRLWDSPAAPIRWYGMAYLAGFVVGYLLVRRVCAVGRSTLSPKHVGDFAVALALGVILGGRLGYVVFYQPSLFFEFSGSMPWWGALAINDGGMASHGGIIGVILASLIYARRHGHSWAHLLDLAAFAAPIGLFFGRVANFINGELLGRVCSADFPLAVKFPQEMTPRFWNAAKFAQLEAALAERGIHLTGSVEQAVPALIDRIQRHDRAVIAAVEPLLSPRHPSQLYAAALEGLVVGAVLLFAWRRPRRPLVIGALFCITYGIVRIVDEFWRLPDDHIAHLEAATLGISRGQWLSALVVIAGVALLTAARRRDAQPMGGWMR